MGVRSGMDTTVLRVICGLSEVLTGLDSRDGESVNLSVLPLSITAGVKLTFSESDPVTPRRAFLTCSRFKSRPQLTGDGYIGIVQHRALKAQKGVIAEVSLYSILDYTRCTLVSRVKG